MKYLSPLLAVTIFGWFLFVLPSSAEAANRYWVSSGAGSTNNPANWASSDPGSCTGGGAGAPGPGDVAIFDADCDSSAIITSSFDVQGVTIENGYTGTVSQSTVTMTIGSAGWTQAGGTFTGNSDGTTANITLNSGGDFDLSGGTFTSTNDTLRINDNWTISGGTFTHNSGTVAFNGDVDGAVSISGSATFNNLTFLNYQGGANCNSILTIADGTTLTANGTLTIGVGTDCMNQRINGTGTISAKGDVTVSGDGFLGSVVITIDGTGTQTLTGSGSDRRFIPSVTIDKASGTLNFSGTITFTDNLTYTAGTLSFGTSTLQFYAEQDNAGTITGSFSPYNVTFMNYNGGNCNYVFTIAADSIVTVTNTLTLGTGGDCNSQAINGPGSLVVEGNLVTANDAYLGDVAITMSGTNAQTITQNGTHFPTGTFTINKSTDTVTLATNFTLAGSGQDLLISNGTLDLSTYTLTVNDVISTGGGGILKSYTGGDIVVSAGGITNAGRINLGDPTTCGASDSSAVTSSSAGVARTWTGNGLFNLYDVAITDQNESPYKGSVVAWSSTNNGNTNFKFQSGCPEAPVAYWQFDEGQGTTAQDSTTNNNDGTLNTSPAWTTEDMCISGKCLRFNQTSDQNVSVPSSASLLPTYITISVWVKFNAANYNARIIDQNSEDFLLNLESDDVATGTKKIRFVTNFGHAIESDSGVPLNEWMHVVATYDGSTSKMFINGIQQADTSSWSGTINQNADTIYLGNTSNGSTPLNGFMDEFKIYNYALTDSQIKSEYNSRGNLEGVSQQLSNNIQNNPAALANGLVGYWKMEEASWTNDCSTQAILDSSGNGNNGVSCPSSTGPTGGAAGKFGRAGNFDGSNDYLSMADSNSLDITQQLTVATWIKADSSDLGNYATIISKRHSESSPYNDWILDTGPNGDTLEFCITDDAGTGPTNGQYCLSNGTLPTSWTHLAGTYDGTTQRMFVNGALVASQAVSITLATSDQPLRIGSSNGNEEYFDGIIDESRVYNRALSPTDITQLYNWAMGPIGYWKMEEPSWDGTSGEVKDSSGYGSNGTSVNGATTGTGKYGKAGNFDRASSQRIDVTNSNSLFTNLAQAAGVTVMGWVNHSSTSAGVEHTLFNQAGGDGRGINLRAQNNGGGPIGEIDCATTNASTTTTAAYTINAWHHVAMVFDPATGLVTNYVDGVNVSNSQTACVGGVVANSSNLRIAANASQHMNGKIDEVKVYNYPRTAGQIIEDMNAGHPAPGSPVGTPIGHWKFNEGQGTTVYNSGSAGSILNGTTNGMAAPATSTSGWNQSGKYGRSLIFDGSDDYVNVPHNDAMDVTQYTLSAWVNFTSVGQWRYIMERSTADFFGNYYLVYDGTQYIYGFNNGSGNQDHTYTTAVTLGRWYHLAVTYDQQNIKLYIDGMLVKTDAQTGTPHTSGTQYLRIGSDNINGACCMMHGGIDEVKVYNQPLTAEQIKIDINQGQAQVLGALGNNSTIAQVQAASQEYCVPGSSDTCTAPVLRYDLEEGSGTSATDTSGSNKTGTITAGTGAYNVGKIGKAYRFDNANTKIQTASTFAQPSSITVEAWIFPITSGEAATGGYIFATGTGLTNMAVGSTNNFRFVRDFNTTDGVWTVTNGITLNAWNHVAVTYNGSSTSNVPIMYVNGVPQTVTTTTSPSGSVVTTAAAWVIGNGSGNANTFNGTIDQIRVFDYIRTPAQIAYDYNKGAPLAYWKVDECQGTTINDSSGNSYTGTLTNATAGSCTTSGAWFNGVNGKRNYSVDLDTDDYIQVSDNANLRFDAATADFSLFAWVKRASNGVMEVINKEDADNDGYRLQFTSGNVVRCSVDAIDIDSTLTITDTNWHLVGCTIDRDGNGQVYIDGRPNGTATAISSEVMANTANLRLGARAYTTANYLDGQIDDARIYNYALTASQVQALFTGGTARYGPVTGAP